MNSSSLNSTMNNTTTDLLHWNDKFSLLLFGLVGSGILLSLGLIILFVFFRKTPLIRASNLTLTIVQLVAHILLFIFPISYFVVPNTAICTTRTVSLGIFFTLIISVTLIKTQKLVFIFQSRIRVSRKEVKISKAMEFFLIFLMLCVQSSITVISFYFNKSRMTKTTTESGNHMVKCDIFEEFNIQLCFGFLLIVMCLIQAFRARSLPENFNETKFILVAMLISVVLVAIFVPLTHRMERHRSRLITNVIAVSCVNLTQLLIMYGYKAWVILMCPEKNTASALKKNLQVHAIQGVSKRMNRCVSYKPRSSLSGVGTSGTVRVSVL